jgi:hypothetical protein
VRGVTWFARSGVWLKQRRSELARLPVLLGRVWSAVRLAKRSGGAPFIAWLEAHADKRPDALFCELDDVQVSFA